MQNDSKVYIDDILESIKKIEKYTKDLDYKKFSENELIIDAVIRNLEVIGEAVKNLPAELKDKYPDLPWRKIAGLRDILIHEYFGLDLSIIWDIVSNKIPELKSVVTKILKNMSS